VVQRTSQLAWYTILSMVYHSIEAGLMPRWEEHEDCKSKREDRGWVALYVRDPQRRVFVRVGRVCPACRKIEDVEEGIGAVFPA